MINHEQSNASLTGSLNLSDIVRAYEPRRTRARDPIFRWLLLSLGLVFVTLAFLSTVNKASRFVIFQQEEATRLSYNPSLTESMNTQQRDFASQVHYVSEIIRSTRRSNAESRKLAYAIVSESLRAGYDPLFVTSVIRSESTFDKNAVSSVGALGLMQVMPATGRYIANKNNIVWRGAAALKEPEYNIRLGIAYLQYLDERFNNNKEHVLIAYNWGPTNLNRAFRQQSRIPGSPRHYASTIIGNHGKWRGDFSQRARQFQYLRVESLRS